MPRYAVRLTIESEMDDEEGAIDAFIETLVQDGMRRFVYRVTNLETDDETFFDGFGNAISEEEVERKALSLVPAYFEDDEDIPVTSEEVLTFGREDVEDEEALDLARDLVQSGRGHDDGDSD